MASRCAAALRRRTTVLTIAFLHPDLGLGGAERFVVDAARAVEHAGHRAVVLTARHEPRATFASTAEGTLDVRVRGAWLPSHLAGRARAPCAVVRMGWLALAAARLEPAPDVVVCHLVAHVVPILRRTARAPVVFYCQYPDRLLASPGGAAYRAYRVPLDWLEARGMSAADRVVVNSRFTAGRFRDAFPRHGGPVPLVIHPGVAPLACPDLPEEPDGPLVVLALGRFDPRKNARLAIETLAELRKRIPSAMFARVQLVLAGGHDERLPEHRETLRSLETLAVGLDLAAHVTIRCNPSERERLALLAECRCVVFPPIEEHFGYVPLEAMSAGRPVIAVARGGPAETVVHGETGLLFPPTPAAFAGALATLLTEPATAARMGRAGRAHVAAHFSLDRFGKTFTALLEDAAVNGSPRG